MYFWRFYSCERPPKSEMSYKKKEIKKVNSTENTSFFEEVSLSLVLGIFFAICFAGFRMEHSKGKFGNRDTKILRHLGLAKYPSLSPMRNFVILLTFLSRKFDVLTDNCLSNETDR